MSPSRSSMVFLLRLAPLLVALAAMPALAQDGQSPALQKLAQARSSYFKALVKITGGRSFVLRPRKGAEQEGWLPRLRGARQTFIQDLEQIITAHPLDRGLGQVRLCAGGELLRAGHRVEARKLLAPLGPTGLDQGQLLQGARYLAALGAGTRAAALCRSLEPARLGGDRNLMVLTGILAAGGGKRADELVRLLFASAQGHEGARQRAEEIEGVAATFRPGIGRPLLARVYSHWVARCPQSARARARARLVPGLELAAGDQAPSLQGMTLGGTPLPARGDQVTLLLFWRQGPAAERELKRVATLASGTHRRPFQPVGLCLEQDGKEASQWLAGKNPTGAVHLHLAEGFEAPLAKAYGILQTPFYLLVDKDNRIMDLGLTGRAVEIYLRNPKTARNEDLDVKPGKPEKRN